MNLNQLQSLATLIKLVVSAEEKVKQGLLDPNSSWSKARNFWVIQILVRFGTTQLERLFAFHYHSKVSPLRLDQIDCWDEKSHKVQESLA